MLTWWWPRKKNISGLRGEPLTVTEELEGLRASRPISAGTVLTTDLFEETPLVNRGDQVQIIAQKGQVQISAVGEAREEGRKGEEIQVRNSSSGETVNAVVVAEGKVEVAL